MLQTPFGHVTHGGNIFADDGITRSGFGGGGDFVDDVAVGFAGAVEMAEAFVAKPDLVDRGPAPVGGVVESGEFLVNGQSSERIAAFIKIVRDFVARLALPIGPDGGFCFSVFLAGLEEFDRFLHGLGVAAEFFEGLDEEVLGLGCERAGREGIEKGLSLGERVCVFTREVGDVGEAESDFARFLGRHFEELDLGIEVAGFLEFARRKMGVGDLHLRAERGVGVVIAGLQLQRGVEHAVEFVQSGGVGAGGAVEAAETKEGFGGLRIIGEISDELLVDHDRLRGLLLFFLKLAGHTQHGIALARCRRAEAHELGEEFFRERGFVHFQCLLDFDLHAFDAGDLADAVGAQTQILFNLGFQ